MDNVEFHPEFESIRGGKPVALRTEVPTSKGTVLDCLHAGVLEIQVAQFDEDNSVVLIAMGVRDERDEADKGVGFFTTMDYATAMSFAQGIMTAADMLGKGGNS